MTAGRARGPLSRGALALAVLAALAPCPAPAEPGQDPLLAATATATTAATRAPLELWVNGGAHGTISVVLRGDDVLVALEDLEAAGLLGLRGARELVDGRLHVALSSLAPALRFAVDDVGLALWITARAEALGRTRVDLRPTARPPDLEVRGDPSAFANYAVHHDTEGRTSGSLEAGASAAGRLLYGSGQLLPDGRAVRGLTSVTADDPAALRRVVAGDVFAGSAGLGAGVLVAGVSVAREYGLDPYRLRAPLPRLAGFSPTPSTLEVWVNGVLRREIQLPPGAYDVANLPVVAGAGDVRTVLRDAYGRNEVVRWSYYYTPTLLPRGESDYGYAAGFRRQRYGLASFEYGRPVLVARHRVGVGESLTLGGRLDLAEGLASGGPSATIGLPFGTLDLELAASRDAGFAGAAALVGYGFTSRWFGAGTLLRLQRDRYASAALAARDERARIQWNSYAGAPVGRRLNLGVTHALVRSRDAPPFDTVSVRADVVVARDLVLGLSASRTRTSSGAGFDVFATLSWAFAPLSVADLATQAGRDGRSTQAGVQRALPPGTGVGFRARGATAPGPAGDDASLLGQAQWEHGRYEVQYERIGPRELGSATAAGGLVVVGGRPFLTRPVQDGFALVRAGVPGIRVYAEGHEVGRTDRRGDLLVASLLPYYGNRLGVADRDVPVEYEIGATERLAAPPYRGGVIAPFEIAPLRAVSGALVTAGGVPPAFGDLTVSAATRAPGARAFASSPVGRDGRFFLQGLPPGEHSGLVDWSGGRCSVSIVVPPEPALVDVGTVSCQAEREPEPELPAPPPPPPAPADEPSTSTSTSTSEDAPAAPPRPAPPPPGPGGYGPRSERCPSCGTCFSAAVGRGATPSALARCVDDLTAMTPGLDRASAEATCGAYERWEAVCRECLDVRGERACPSWPE